MENEKIFDGKRAISVIENSHFFVPRNADCWTDLENALTFDYQRYIKEYIDAFDRDINIKDYESCVSQINAANKVLKYSPEQIARDFTNTWFWEWIAKQYYNNIGPICAKKKNDILYRIVDEDSMCINFNYTHTLEDMLKLEQKQILYIHNRLPDKREISFAELDFERDILEPSKKQFQFGSVNNNYSEWKKLIDSIKLKSNQQLMKIDDLKKSLKEIYLAFSKETAGNYPILENFLKCKVGEISEVIVLGHSILGVDEPYYRDVIIPLMKNKKWVIYWHNNDSEATKFVDKYDLIYAQIVRW